MAAAFNTFRFLETLEASGRFSPEQAKDLAKALDASQADADLVTNAELRAAIAEINTRIEAFKGDINTRFESVNTRIEAARNQIILWVIGVQVVLYGGLFAVMAKGFGWF